MKPGRTTQPRNRKPNRDGGESIKEDSKMATVEEKKPSIEAAAKANEKEQVERTAAVAGASAVADAIKRAADAAVEGARSQSGVAPLGDFRVTGSPGGRFELRANSGPIFSSGGSVFVNGRRQHVDEWGADYIRGRLDADVTSGEVVVPIDEKTRRVGYLKV